ncbi:MAG: hypothetical protein HZB13_05165 [Acidobacteria bacterium]|nr:hypothetical protein [Acidobacteriota bacterium]
MRHAALLYLVAGLVAGAALVWGQRERLAPAREIPTWEYRALAPQEMGKGRYQQVSWDMVQSLGAQGWELVGVTSWVIRNDEHLGSLDAPPKVVTQNYVAYYFKRQRPMER